MSVNAQLSGVSDVSMTVVSFMGVDTSGSNGSGAVGATGTGNAASGTPSATLTTTRNNSLVFGLGEDPAAATARTLSANQVQVSQLVNPCIATPPFTCPQPGDTFWVQQVATAVPNSGSVVTLKDTAPNNDPYNFSAVEILSATVSSSAPVLTSLSAIAGAPGTSITISGVNFGTTQGSSALTFNGTPAIPSSWTATSITAPVPNGATTGNVVVTVGGQASNGLKLIVTNPSGLAIDQVAIGGVSSGAISGATLTTSSGNEVLLAFVGTAPNGNSNGGATIISPPQGGGLTWVQVEKANQQTGTAEVWRAFAPYILDSVPVTYNPTLGSDVLLTVVAMLGADASGTNGAGAIGAMATTNAASGAPTATLTTTRANSIVLGAGDDPSAGVSRAVGANQKKLAEVVNNTCVGSTCTPGSYTLWMQQVLGSIPAAGTSVTVTDVTPTADAFNLSIVEVLPSTTPLIISVSASPAANAAGWNNSNVTVSFTCSGGVAPISCPSPITVTTEGANQVITGTAIDARGVQASASVTLRIDKTAPTIAAVVTPAANAQGVVTAPATVSFTCSDSLSGVAICPAPIQVTTAGLNETFSGTATDIAGNISSPVTLTFSVQTAPLTIVASATPVANAAGWNNTNVTISYTCSGGVAPVQCPGAQVISAEGANQAISAVTTDAAGQTSSVSSLLSIDKTLPTIATAATPAPNSAGWNNSPVTVSFTCSDALSGVAACPSPIIVVTDGANQTISGTAIDQAGNSASNAATVSLDRTPPLITGVISPAPDAKGVNTTSATVNFNCSDSLSGILACSPPVAVSTPGVQFITGSAVDKAGNSAQVKIRVNIQAAPLQITSSLSPSPNSAGWNNAPVTVTFQCSGGVPPVLCPQPQTVSKEGRNQKIHGTVADAVGNSASTAATVSLDKTPPSITVTAPIGNNVNTGIVNLQGLVVDALSGLATVNCNGTAATATGTAFACSLVLTPGSNTIGITATDIAGNSVTSNLSLNFVNPIPISIVTPTPRQLFSTNPITVTGTVGNASATVTVAGVTATVNNGTFTATGVVLHEDKNLLTASAASPDGSAGSATVTVYLDTTPPVVHIDTPSDGTIVTSPQIDVFGNVNDLVTGTVNGDQVSVSVNGVSAGVANRSFAARGLLLVPGLNTITAVATDRAGNTSQHKVHVTLQQITGQQALTILSGNNQTAPVRTVLPTPLLARATDAIGRPLVGTVLNFAVTKSDGVITSGQQTARVLSVVTDANGTASVQFQLGSRSCVGCNQVTVSAPGFVSPALFSADGTLGAPSRIHTVSREVQNGAIGEALAEPLVAIVTDATSNPVPNVPVTFTVRAGGGLLNGQPTLVQNTDSDGKASTILVLGQQEGINNNVVTASFSGLAGRPAVFQSSGFVPGPVANTTVSGVVLDDANQPIANVTASIKGTSLSALTNASGRFTISNVPVGDLVLFIDGSTSTDPESYPTLSFQIATVPGIDNTLPGPIFLPAIDANNSQVVGGDQDVILTMNGVPGVAYKVFAHSVTFPDGTKVGRVTLSQVHSDKVPMTPPNGTAPRLVGTLQPAGIKFDPPIQMTLPNTDVLAPGQVQEIFSFHHDVEQFVVEGTFRVSEDGSVLVSDPGFGLSVSGWHGAGGSGNEEPPTCGDGCDTGDSCQVGACGDDGECEFSAEADGTSCDNGDSCIANATCTAGVCGGDPITITSADGAADGNNPDTTGINQPVNFNATVTQQNCDSSQLNFTWDFGDGTTGSGPSPTHQYAAVGAYSASVNVTCGECADQSAGADVEVDVVTADVNVNGTADTSDDFTTLNLPIPVQIQLHGGPAVVKLTVSPAGSATLDRDTLNLDADASDTVTLTPLVVSASVGDVTITATVNGKQIGSGSLTIANITISTDPVIIANPINRVRAGNTPGGMPDRIPPTALTGVLVTVTPDLSSLSLFSPLSTPPIHLIVRGNNATNGDLTMADPSNIFAPSTAIDLASTTTVQLAGTVQTVPTGDPNNVDHLTGLFLDAGGGNASQIKLVAQVRGQDAVLTQGFSVAAIPDNFTATFLGNVNEDDPFLGQTIGLRVTNAWTSDSGPGNLQDLSAVRYKEIVQLQPIAPSAAGVFKGITQPNTTKSFQSATSGSVVDRHSLRLALVTSPLASQCDILFTCTIAANQVHVFEDLRTGATWVVAPRSGFVITTTINSNGTTTRTLTTTKVGAAVSPFNFSAGAASTVPPAGIQNVITVVNGVVQ
jgi:hypothetical protein